MTGALLGRVRARAVDALAVAVVLVGVAIVVAPRVHGNTPIAAPDVQLEKLDGSRFDLRRERGHVVFLDFLATWCEPCRDEIPLVRHFAQTHPDAIVLSVDAGESAGLVAPYARAFHLDAVALDSTLSVTHSFAVAAYPTVVAIDAEGRVRGRWIGVDTQIERDLFAALASYRPRS